MAIGRYYGHAAGAVATYSRSGSGQLLELTIGRVDRNPPEGADWLCAFTPRRKIAPKDGSKLAERLSKLANQYWGNQLEADRYMDAIDCAIVDFETRPN
jgi:hypothetical protein